MMKCRKLVALLGLYFCAVFGAEADSAIEPVLPARHSIQVVVRPDGSVIDRLALPNNAQVSPRITARPAGTPASPEAWLVRMLDPTRNGLAVKHPELFAEWLDAVTEPRFMTALASVAISPETYSKTLGKAVDPATVRNWAEFADPQVYLRWMAAGINPGFYQAIFDRMTDSGKLKRWGLIPTDFSNASISPGYQAEPSDSQKPVAAAQEWMQLRPRDAKSNPWLLNGVNYRY